MVTQVKRPKIWTDRVRSAWDLPEELTVSEWADRSIILDEKTNAEPGNWRTRRTPYLRGIMDAFGHKMVREITVMASTQIGKSALGINCLCYAMDQDPGPALWVGAREEDVKTFSSKRILPIIQASPVLRRHITPNLDDITKLEINLERMTTYFAGSNSPAALSSKPIRYLFLDEIDKYPKFSGREADPIKLATERTRTFYNRKIVKKSTPTTKDGYIWREYEKSNQCEFYVPCYHCGHYQTLNFMKGVKFPKDERDPDVIVRENLAWYECEKCAGKNVDVYKSKMLLGGQWVPDGWQISNDGCYIGPDGNPREFEYVSHMGFWINCLYSPWLTFSEVAAEWLRSYGDRETLMNFTNSWLAETFQEKFSANKVDDFKLLADTYQKRVVPAGVTILVAGVDVQKHSIYYTIRGWGYRQESWLVHHAEIESWEELELDLFETPYISENGEELQIYLANIDTGYRTDEVYDFCIKWRGRTRPVKGMSSASKGIPIKSSVTERKADGTPIKGGLRMWSVDTNYFKDKLARLIFNAQDGSGIGFHLYQDPSEVYCRQMCSEHKIPIIDKKRGEVGEKWEKVTKRADNHYWDCEVYAVAAAHMLRVYAPNFGLNRAAPARPAPESNKERFVRKRPGGWIRRK